MSCVCKVRRRVDMPIEESLASIFKNSNLNEYGFVFGRNPLVGMILDAIEGS